jgi:hypothetical protein
MNNNIEPMPTQNLWAWVGLGMGTQCRALVGTNHVVKLYVNHGCVERLRGSTFLTCDCVFLWFSTLFLCQTLVVIHVDFKNGLNQPKG